MRLIWRSAALILAVCWCGQTQPAADEVLLFSYFRDNGQAGVFLAATEDGVRFTALNGDKPIFTAPGWTGQNLTRDPSIIYRDGLFRMVWTSNWKGLVFGYAESADLVQWSTPVMVRPFAASLPEEDQPENIWAPEIHWDPNAKEYFILLAATTKWERTDGDGSDNKGDNTSPYDNRMHIVRTADGRTFSDARLFFDQGFTSIDAVTHLDQGGKRWAMIIKDSRDANLKWMPGRNLRVSFTGLNLNRLEFTPVSEPIAGDNAPMFTEPKNSMAEGSSLIRHKGEWWLYWDEPAGSGMNLATSPDLKVWTHRKTVVMPPRAQQGTAFFAPRRAVGWLTLSWPFLQPSPNGRYLVRQDGTPFLWIGDAAWYAGVKATMSEWTEYLEDRKRKGFTVVQISAGRTPPGWQGGMPFDSAGQPNDAHWDGIVAKVREANRRGIVVLVVGVGHPTSAADIAHVTAPEYGRYLARKFEGLEVILSPNFDGAYSPVFDTVAENLMAAGTKLPITQHPNTRQGQNEIYVPKAYLTFSGLQSGHHNGRLEAAYGAAREWPLSLWAMKPVRPVINIEGMYDGRGSDDGPAWRGKDVRKIGWISWLSGALGYTYAAGETARKVPGTNGGVWGWNQDEAAFDSWRKAAAWPSSSFMTIMRDFFGSIEWWRLEPAHELIFQEGTPDNQTRAVFAASTDRTLAVAYAPSGGRFRLDLQSFPKTLRAEWFDPATGKRTPAKLSEWLTPPAGTDDAALLLRP